AERRVADLVLADPHAVAFGTVAEVARAARTSGGSVVRTATRLGLDGFAALQDRVRTDLRTADHPAVDRIRRPPADDPLGQAVAVAVAAVGTTLDRVERTAFDAAVARLADPAHQAFVLVADASRGIGEQFATELAMLRPGVTHVHGSEVAVARALALLAPGDVVVTLDLPRYDRWLLAAVGAAHEAGARIVALTGSELSPLADLAELVFPVSSEAAGPFDSHLAALALLEALVAGVAATLQATATSRLERIEAAWRAGATFTDG
ncbi:MAG TPA: MurR/RpiR family transcriptional regulator, partial [Aquihabitans sp.]|nr:MurR/RpiR family transcriptional regulator [Aquihabitans sp.]